MRYGKKRLTHPTPTPLITDIFIATMVPQSGMKNSLENPPLKGEGAVRPRGMSQSGRAVQVVRETSPYTPFKGGILILIVGGAARHG